MWFCIHLIILVFSFRSPVGSHCVSREDYNMIKRKGLAVVDCSWARLEDVPFVKLRCASPRLCMNIHSFEIMSFGRTRSTWELLSVVLNVVMHHFIVYLFNSWQQCINGPICNLSWIHYLFLISFYLLLGFSLWNWKFVLNCSTVASSSKSSKLWSTLSAILCRGFICRVNNMVQVSPEPLHGINSYATISFKLLLVLMFTHYS